jgi:hypothetical protein
MKHQMVYSKFLEWFNENIYMVPLNWCIEKQFTEVMNSALSKNKKINEMVYLIDDSWETIRGWERTAVKKYLRENIEEIFTQ